MNSGGNINGCIAAAEKVIILADNETKIIPRHRNIANNKKLIAFKIMRTTSIEIYENYNNFVQRYER